MTKQRTGAHTTRNQETRDAVGVHDEPISFEAQGPLPAIGARAGFTQRWIRARKGNEPDAQNLFAATRRGWTPRSPDTVPKSLQFLTVQREGIGGCVGTHDMVLMERPNELNAREAAVKRDDRRAREHAVKNNLFSEFKSMGGNSTGFTAPDVQNQARIERGRAPSIQDD